MFTSPWLVLLCTTTKLVPGPRSPPSVCSLGPVTFYVDRAISDSEVLLLYIFIATLAQISGLTY